MTSFDFADDVVGFILKEKLDSEALRKIKKMLEERIQKFSKISLFLEDQEDDGMSLKAFVEELGFEVSHQSAFRKIAVVTDVQWFQLATQTKNLFVDAEVKFFSTEDRLDALNWVME